MQNHKLSFKNVVTYAGAVLLFAGVGSHIAADILNNSAVLPILQTPVDMGAGIRALLEAAPLIPHNHIQAMGEAAQHLATPATVFGTIGLVTGVAIGAVKYTVERVDDVYRDVRTRVGHLSQAVQHTWQGLFGGKGGGDKGR